MIFCLYLDSQNLRKSKTIDKKKLRLTRGLIQFFEKVPTKNLLFYKTWWFLLKNMWYLRKRQRILLTVDGVRLCRLQ